MHTTGITMLIRYKVPSIAPFIPAFSGKIERLLVKKSISSQPMLCTDILYIRIPSTTSETRVEREKINLETLSRAILCFIFFMFISNPLLSGLVFRVKLFLRGAVFLICTSKFILIFLPVFFRNILC
ncbi:hypothetical protein SDC9_154324 [bioreactor metagenome]|uniref:Uncharacterized protein n=1 Tax=bioreactor metagenome TaxID=1076179 RepID=A0A645EYE1_9ZZZZ